MALNDVMFYALSILIIAFSAAVILLPNPIYAALSLAVTMVSLGFVYFLLEAYFIAGVQLIVYAGAVMVLFVMVLMLFDLKKETESFSGGAFSIFLKLACGLFITGAVALAVRSSVAVIGEPRPTLSAIEQVAGVKELAGLLFTRYLFAFEALGVLLLLIAIGVVAVSRARGGTHARD
jgi:NADH-quinone oxidoreductase subunit J